MKNDIFDQKNKNVEFHYTQANMKIDIKNKNSIENLNSQPNNNDIKTDTTVNKNDKEISFIRAQANKNKKFEADLDIISYLNSGSCGDVYLGEIKMNKKKVAIKRIMNKKKQNTKPHFRREVSIMNKMKNRNCVNLYGVYEAGEEDSNIFLVIEYAKYGDIDQFQKLVQKKTFSESLLAYITKQILYALLFCQRSGIAHLDIKHQNLLIDESLIVKLTDFSVSQEYKDTGDKIQMPMVGTSLFMSYEILTNYQLNYNDVNKIDIYSLGVLIYHLAFNSYPYGLIQSDKNSFNSITTKIKENRLYIPVQKKHSEVFRSFLKGLLEKDINVRLSVEQALNSEWMKCADNIFSEKDKISDLEKFLINLVTDNFKSFNDSLRSVKIDKPRPFFLCNTK